MAGILDYINWRGDLTFAQSPLNEVDSLILANLSYVPFDSIVPSPWEEDSITLREASEAFWREKNEKDLLRRFSLIKMTPFSMRRIAETKRFGDMKLMYYQNSVRKEEHSQFSAICIQIEKGNYFLAFRGTDDTIIGWEENFRMCFETVPAQRKAADYLNYVGRKLNGNLWLGGHSKGGNLAVYAAAKARPQLQQRIQGIYNNDGPGFSKSMLSSIGYQRIKKKIHKYVPDASLIGMLLEHDENFTIVSSGESGLKQHDPTTWRVLGTQFVSIPKRKAESRFLSHTVHEWIYSLSLEERKQFVTSLFDVMEESEIETLDDFGENRWRSRIRQIRKGIHGNPDYRQAVKRAGQQMLEEFGKSLTAMKRIKKEKRVPRDEFH